MKGLIAWFAGNHITANLLMVFLIIAGLTTALGIKLEVFPEFSLDQIVVSAVYPGASPEEVEKTVIKSIEENVAGLAGVKRIDSVAREGLGTVTIEIVRGWDLQKLLDEVKSEVDRITTFPIEVEKPTIREVTRRRQVINLAVYGDAPERTIKHWAERIQDELTALPGITMVEIFGVRHAEIHIEVPEENLRKHGITLGQVAEAVARSSLDLPAGTVKTAGGEILVRAKGRLYEASDYREVTVLSSLDGTRLTLGQIANLEDSFEDVDIFARFQGQRTALLQVFRVADQNALEVAAAVNNYVSKTKPTLPPGIGLELFGDRSIILKSRMELLLRNMALGLLLVSLLMGFILNLRLAFWIITGIFVSFMAGIWALPWFGVSINMISLFAFIMVLGIVVDDAIVIGENIFRKREEGLDPLQAGIEGAHQLSLPVMFSVLTTVAAFWPLLLAGGMMGKIIRGIPIVVIVVLSASLLESLLILPAHLVRSRASRKIMPGGKGRTENTAARWLWYVIRGPYAWLLELAIRWRYVTAALGLAALLLAAGWVGGGRIRFVFMPKIESDNIIANLTMPADTPTEQLFEAVGLLEKAAVEALAEVDQEREGSSEKLFQHSLSLVGGGVDAFAAGPGGVSDGGASTGQVTIQLLESEKRNVSTDELVARWRERLGQIPDAESLTFSGEIFRAGSPVEIHLTAESEEKVLMAAEELKEELAEYEGVSDVSDSFLAGKREMQLKLKSSARSLGLTLEDLARQVRHALYGAEALRLVRDRDEVKVMVLYPEEDRRSLGEVEGMRIRTLEGDEVPFSTVAEVEMKMGYSSIERAQRRRVIKVSADVDPAKANANEVRTQLVQSTLPALMARYPDLYYSLEGEGREQQESLADVYKGFAVALFIIFALLVVPLRSFSQPLIVMSAIPFGLVGALLGHVIMGLNISLLSMFGMVGLAGVVVNDSLVLIHAANSQRAGGLEPRQAILAAGPMRFRPVVLTSLTTFAGLLPMILEKSLQAKFLIPMAVSLGFGVLFATGITLVLVPCNYMILNDLNRIRLKATSLFGGNWESM
jgi:multidrug efflux pump subunit AcrB